MDSQGEVTASPESEAGKLFTELTIAERDFIRLKYREKKKKVK